MAQRCLRRHMPEYFSKQCLPCRVRQPPFLLSHNRPPWAVSTRRPIRPAVLRHDHLHAHVHHHPVGGEELPANRLLLRPLLRRPGPVRRRCPRGGHGKAQPLRVSSALKVVSMMRLQRRTVQMGSSLACLCMRIVATIHERAWTCTGCLTAFNKPACDPACSLRS